MGFDIPNIVRHLAAISLARLRSTAGNRINAKGGTDDHRHHISTGLRTFIDEQLATKGYGNLSEYVRSLPRDAKHREENAQLEALLVEGLATGGGDMPFSREFWNELRAEAMDLAKKHHRRKKPQ
ncbi:MAG: hypothetical protein NTV52_07050 [Acidobacteria bacterium]|nr:hypothetical protein [Acidobacteriota bacterium]